MKIRFRTQQTLQRKIDRHLRQIEIAGNLFFDKSKVAAWGSLRDVYRAIADAGCPVDYRYVTEAIGLPHTQRHHWRVATRIAWLGKRGYAQETGRGPSKYRNFQGAKLYVAVPPDQIPIVRKRLDRAIARMLDDIEPASYLANDVPQCLARRIETNERNGLQPRMYGYPVTAERNAEIVRMRLDGVALKDIGDKFGITRERTRQIFERAIRGDTVDRRHLPTMQKPKWLDHRPNRHTRAALVGAADAILRMPAKEAPDAELEQLARDIIAKATR